MTDAVPPKEPPAIVDKADGSFGGNWSTGENQTASVRYRPKDNTLTLGGNHHNPKTQDGHNWAMVFAAPSRDRARTAAENYQQTGDVPKAGAKNFYCSATFNGVTRTEQVTHVPQLENMSADVIKAAPHLQGLQGTGPAYSYTSGGKIDYARGQAAVDSMMLQAKKVCGLIGNIPKFTP